MSDIAVQRKDQPQASTIARRELDPFRLMRDMLRWDPFREMAPTFSVELPSYSPAFEVKDTKESFVFKADVPGTKEQDIEVNVAGNRLTIAGKREAEKEEKSDTFYAYERSYGSFQRILTLSQAMEVRLEQVTTSHDLLQDIQLRIRKLEDYSKDIEVRYERLEKRREVLDNTTDGVDRNFALLEKVEKANKSK